MANTKHNQAVMNKLPAKQINTFAVLTRPWFVEGVFYSTFIALLWTNEEPSKLNTLFVAWSAYTIVAFSIYRGIKARTIINPTRWIRVYFIQSLLLLLVCDFVWLQGSVPRALGDYFDAIRFDYAAVMLAESGMDPTAIYFSNHTGVVWYAGFIYWIFGVSKFYVVLFNGAFAFVTWILFASIMSGIEGNPGRWQWLRFGAVLPDFIIYFATVTKGPLSAFIVALGTWLIARGLRQKKIYSGSIMFLIPVLILGLTIRAATSVIIFIVALIWLWQYSGKKGKIAAIVLLVGILIGGQMVTNYIMKITGSMDFNFSENMSILLDPAQRFRSYAESTEGSWNMIFESLPMYLMPVIAPVKGFFMMISPMPFWDLNIETVLSDVFFTSNYASPEVKQLFQKTNAIMFLASLPLIMTAFFDLYRSDRGLWIKFSFVFVILISFMGFAVFGMIEARYRAMLLPFWLSVCGIGYYYGKPRRYILPTIVSLALGAVVYLVPKIF